MKKQIALKASSTKLILPALVSASLVISCSTGKCRDQKKEKPVSPVDAQTQVLSNPPSADMVPTQPGARKESTAKVFKPDGSKQCGEAPGVELSEMEKQLKGARVISRQKSTDGKMHMQVCGADTGDINLYEIPTADLAKALKAGFKELK
jgi:hypothetical protein